MRGPVGFAGAEGLGLLCSPCLPWLIYFFFWLRRGGEGKGVVFPHPWVFFSFACNGRAFPAPVLPSSGTGGFFLQPKVCKQESRAGEGAAGHSVCVSPHPRGCSGEDAGVGSIRLTSCACIP